jgi:hypothetical protein
MKNIWSILALKTFGPSKHESIWSIVALKIFGRSNHEKYFGQSLHYKHLSAHSMKNILSIREIKRFSLHTLLHLGEYTGILVLMKSFQMLLFLYWCIKFRSRLRTLVSLNFPIRGLINWRALYASRFNQSYIISWLTGQTFAFPG